MLLSAQARAAITATGDVMPLPIIPNTTIQVADQGVGSVVIDGGSTLTSSYLRLALGPNGVGTAIVRDPGSFWQFTDGDIGYRGVGRLEVRGGAIVEVPSPANLLRLGFDQSSNGTILVDGDGSILQVLGALAVGQQGNALLRASNGALVNVPEDTTQVGVNGRIELDDAVIRMTRFRNLGTVIGNGELELGPAVHTNSGRIEAGPGDRLLVSGYDATYLHNHGTIVVDGGELEFRQLVTNLNSFGGIGHFTMRDGTVRFSQFENGGLFAAIGGENHVYGGFYNGAEIVATNNSTVFFYDGIGGNIAVAAGSTVIVFEGLYMSDRALRVELGGADNFGHAEVYGPAVFQNASLEVRLSNGFIPSAGDSFVLLSADGRITGTPSLGGTPIPSNLLEWDLDVDPYHVIVSAMPALDGDFNANGIVDAADYVIWRKLLDQTGPGLVADGDDNNIVNGADYDTWRCNLGRTIGESAVAIAAVPEPATMFLLVATGLLPLGRRRTS